MHVLVEAAYSPVFEPQVVNSWLSSLGQRLLEVNQTVRKLWTAMETQPLILAENHRTLFTSLQRHVEETQNLFLQITASLADNIRQRDLDVSTTIVTLQHHQQLLAQEAVYLELRELTALASQQFTNTVSYPNLCKSTLEFDTFSVGQSKTRHDCSSFLSSEGMVFYLFEVKKTILDYT